LLDTALYSDGSPPTYKVIMRSVTIEKGKTMCVEETFDRK